jgi:hypothetical protein
MLIVDQDGAYRSESVHAERVVGTVVGALLFLEDDDGARRLIGRPDFIRIESAAPLRQSDAPRQGPRALRVNERVLCYRLEDIAVWTRKNFDRKRP